MLPDNLIDALTEVGCTGSESLTVVDRAIGIDDDETGNARHAPLLTDELMLFFIAEELQPFGLVFLQFVMPSLFVAVDADADKLDLRIILIVGHMLLDMRDLGAAWAAPGSPHIDIGEPTPWQYPSTVHAAIRELPEKYQQLFELNYEQGLKNEEVARLLEISINGFNKRKAKMISLLRDKFKDNELMQILITVLLV